MGMITRGALSILGNFNGKNSNSKPYKAHIVVEFNGHRNSTSCFCFWIWIEFAHIEERFKGAGVSKDFKMPSFSQICSVILFDLYLQDVGQTDYDNSGVYLATSSSDKVKTVKKVQKLYQ